ncbi:MAG: acyl-CoA synthetase [Acidobacteria bacterium]|nr:MAG: acyl-CoA synthetase [Acidobacteriota bacterium]
MIATDGWNFGDVFEVIAEELPDAPAQAQGDRRMTWFEFDRRADGVARALIDEANADKQDKVAIYLYNCPEYIETVFACMKAGLVPVNTNYRYGDEELLYLWDNADAIAVVFHGVFAERIEPLREKAAKVRLWLWVDDCSGDCPDWAVPYEEPAELSKPGDRTIAPWGRSGKDLYMLYTGGTTGMPKGVMWQQDDLYRVFVMTTKIDPLEPDLDHVRNRIKEPGPVCTPACPLMHGTGAFVSYQAMMLGGSIVTLEGRHFDVVEFLDTIEREKVASTAIVGDAFAKPILRALDTEPDRWDISSLKMITSSGVMWSEAVKEGLLKHHPMMMLVDAFSSSEALGMGQSVSTAGGAAKTAKFMLGERTRVVTDEGRDVVPGSGEIGVVALKGPNPIGYYKDPDKTAATFREIDGERYSIPGDYAMVEADGSLKLLGRGSVCINTGGEKVYPEEVEEVIKELPEALDAVIVGVPDDRFGEAIVALVEPRDQSEIGEAAVIAHVKDRLAHYKAPKRVLAIDSIGRSPAGKVDYKGLRSRALEELGISDGG